jgi:hypothetical protein
VVALGENAEGERYRRAIDRAAKREGMKVVPWARRELLKAAGVTVDEAPTREEFNLLSKRVEWLEARASVDTRGDSK